MLLEKKMTAITLNVGGIHYTTTIDILTRYKDSMLALMFSGQWNMKQEEVDEDGNIFIDRDGILFKYVLEYLQCTIPMCRRRWVFRQGDVLKIDWLHKTLIYTDIYQLLALKREFDLYGIEMLETRYTRALMVHMKDKTPVVTVQVGVYDPYKNNYDIVVKSIPIDPCSYHENLKMCMVDGCIYISSGYYQYYAHGRKNLPLKKYDLKTKLLTTVTSFPIYMDHHVLCVIGSIIYLIENNMFINDENGTGLIYAYNTSSGHWISDIATLPAQRSNFTVCAVGTCLYVIGGCEDSHCTMGAFTENGCGLNIYRYDSFGNKWTVAGRLHTAVHVANVCVFEDRYIYIIGGFSHNNREFDNEEIKKVCRFDTHTGIVKNIAPMKYARSRAVVYVLDRYIYVSGDDGIIERYDPVFNSWEVTGKNVLGDNIYIFPLATEENIFDLMIRDIGHIRPVICC